MIKFSNVLHSFAKYASLNFLHFVLQDQQLEDTQGGIEKEMEQYNKATNSIIYLIRSTYKYLAAIHTSQDCDCDLSFSAGDTEYEFVN